MVLHHPSLPRRAGETPISCWMSSAEGLVELGEIPMQIELTAGRIAAQARWTGRGPWPFTKSPLDALYVHQGFTISW